MHLSLVLLDQKPKQKCKVQSDEEQIQPRNVTLLTALAVLLLSIPGIYANQGGRHAKAEGVCSLEEGYLVRV